LRAWVAKEIGALARPDDIRFTEQLPKTRSGKIMRRLLRELATNGEIKGDTTTLEDFNVMLTARRGRIVAKEIIGREFARNLLS